MKFIPAFKALLCTSLLLGCSEKTTFEVKTPLVDVYQIPKSSNQNIQKFPAVVAASELTELSFRVRGELISIPASSGTRIKKGELIAKLDPTDFELAVKDKKSKVDLSKLSMDRAKKLVLLGSLAESTFDELEAQYRIAKAAYELALLDFKYTELRAPFTGIISSVPADNFQSVSVGETIATMHRIDVIDIQVELPDAILAATNASETNRDEVVLDVNLDAYPDFTFKGTYKEHTTEHSDEEKTYLLTLEMPVDEKRIALQGMPGSVEIDLIKLQASKDSSVKVPVEAVVFPDSSTDKQRVVWRLNDDFTVEAVDVEANDIQTSSSINVIGKLREGDKIVVQGLMYLHDGLTVQVREQMEGTL